MYWSSNQLFVHHNDQHAARQADVIPLARQLGIGIVPWGPLGTGFLTGTITSRADLKDGDYRKAAHGRMTDESFAKVRGSLCCRQPCDCSTDRRYVCSTCPSSKVNAYPG